jgi:hypothetical protein
MNDVVLTLPGDSLAGIKIPRTQPLGESDLAQDAAGIAWKSR